MQQQQQHALQQSLLALALRNETRLRSASIILSENQNRNPYSATSSPYCIFYRVCINYKLPQLEPAMGLGLAILWWINTFLPLGRQYN